MKRTSSKSRQVLGHWTAREKATLLKEYRRSGLSLLAYAQQHQLCYSTLIRWRKRSSQGAQSQTAAQVQPALKFVPVHLEPEPVPGPFYVLSLSGGRSLKIPPGFESESLRRLLSVLEGSQ